ncbi:MAG: hypothetical protein UZ09_BCD002001225 [Bacteroidetes bacterium OLB9]|nr:MAG: hypothetical protein UZ09_BCD002001225 [Bacteroidetes bacterium OLB9]
MISLKNNILKIYLYKFLPHIKYGTFKEPFVFEATKIQPAFNKNYKYQLLNFSIFMPLY